MCVSCNLKLVPLANAGSYAHQIPLEEFSGSNSRCKFKVMYCTSPDKVNEALKVVDLNISSMAEMERLADYYDSGEATAYYRVDLWQLLKKIVFTPEELSKTECNLACTY